MMDIMNPTNIKLFDMITEVNGLRERTFPVTLYCYDTDTKCEQELVSSYKIGAIFVNDSEEMLIYRLKFENEFDEVSTLIATCIYNYKYYTFNYILRNEDSDYQYNISF